MYRASSLATRALGAGVLRPSVRSQWPVSHHAIVTERYFADSKLPAGGLKDSIRDSKAAVLPGTSSTTTTNPTPPIPGPLKNVSAGSISSPTKPSSSTIPADSVPLTPPPPPPGPKTRTSPPTSLSGSSSSSDTTPPLPPPPPPAPKRKPRRIRRLLLTLILLGGLGYGGGVFYSLRSDNFHDFFTEYIPYGEEAVLFFEERAFRQRFPAIKSRAPSAPRDTGNRVTIPSKSGISWKVSEIDEKPKESPDGPRGSPSSHGPRITDVKKAGDVKPTPKSATSEQPKPAKETSSIPVGNQVEGKAENKSLSADPAKTSSEKTSTTTPIPAIDPININDADMPLVQDLVKLMNNIITVVNADQAAGKYSSSIESAKAELAKVGSKIKALKKAEQESAEQKIRASHEEFDGAAKELVGRLEQEMQEQEARWRDEFEAEREKIYQQYLEKLKVEEDRSKDVSEQRLQNMLLEQALEMKRSFKADIKKRVEEERNGRLSKLSELQDSVSELEKLTSEWNSVVDTTLKAQHLHVAVEAVRANIENATQPRPFVRELAALKEIADNDPIVDAAIASISPPAYQRGVPSASQLIDRFRRVASEVRKASLLPENAGVASHAASRVLSSIMFKKKGLAVGDDVESILTRTETLLEEGNLDGAAREMNGLNGWAKTLSEDWLGDVRKVLEVNQALDVISTEARLQTVRIE